MERKKSIVRCFAGCVGLLWAGAALPQISVPSDRVEPPVAGQIGTSQIMERGLGGAIGPGNAPRVGVLAYCSDLAPNAATYGLMAYQPNGSGGLVQGGWARHGQFGAQNLVDMLMYDDGIPRFRDVVLVDGDRTLPSSTDLLRNFDCVIAFSDRQCGIPIPAAIANSAGAALAGFANAGKGVVLTGFAFSTSIGFGDQIFAAGLSPLRKGGPAIDTRCSRSGLNDRLGNPVAGSPCPIGSCAGLVGPAGGACTPQGSPALCLDSLGNFCGRPNYQVAGADYPVTADLACDHMLAQLDGPTTSSWATQLTNANTDPGATLCFDYDIAGTPLPLLAINARRNVVAVNTYPPDASDMNKFWYQCLIGNAVQYACGARNKCTARGCPQP